MSAFLLFFIIFCLNPDAYAELYECDGKWTNLPCSGEIERVLNEKVHEKYEPNGVPEKNLQTQKLSDEPLAPRYMLARRLRKFNKEFFEQHNLSLSKEEINQFESQCTRKEISFEECQKQHDQLVKKLTQKIKGKKER